MYSRISTLKVENSLKKTMSQLVLGANHCGYALNFSPGVNSTLRLQSHAVTFLVGDCREGFL